METTTYRHKHRNRNTHTPHKSDQPASTKRKQAKGHGHKLTKEFVRLTFAIRTARENRSPQNILMSFCNAIKLPKNSTPITVHHSNTDVGPGPEKILEARRYFTVSSDGSIKRLWCYKT